MLNIKIMIASAEEALGWPYVSPGTNDARGIDCSGLFVKMYKDQGASIYHGSNTIYRKYCGDKGKLTSASQLAVGMAVFKWNPNTPAKFDDGLGDFQHIGFVASVNPLQIIHASSAVGCVTIDYKIGKWAYWGKLKDVDYSGSDSGGGDDGKDDKDMPEEKYADVYAESGNTVKMREKPSSSCNIYWEVPIGATVQVLDPGTEWSKIKYDGKTGYMMTKFLKEHDDGGDKDDHLDELERAYYAIEEAMEKMEKAYDIIGDILGLRG